MNNPTPTVFDPQAVAPNGFVGSAIAIGVVEAAEKTGDLSGYSVNELTEGLVDLEGSIPVGTSNAATDHIRVELRKRHDKANFAADIAQDREANADAASVLGDTDALAADALMEEEVDAAEPDEVQAVLDNEGEAA